MKITTIKLAGLVLGVSLLTLVSCGKDKKEQNLGFNPTNCEKVCEANLHAMYHGVVHQDLVGVHNLVYEEIEEPDDTFPSAFPNGAKVKFIVTTTSGLTIEYNGRCVYIPKGTGNGKGTGNRNSPEISFTDYCVFKPNINLSPTFVLSNTGGFDGIKVYYSSKLIGVFKLR